MTSALLIGRKRSNGPTLSAIISQVPRASGKPEAAGLQILCGHIREHSRIPPFTSNTGKPCLATPTCLCKQVLLIRCHKVYQLVFQRFTVTERPGLERRLFG